MSTSSGSFENNVKQVVRDETTSLNHPKVYFAPYPSSMANTGCDWHPSLEDNKKVAKILIDTIMKKLEWDTAAPVMTVSRNNRLKNAVIRPFSISTTGDAVFFTVPHLLEPGTFVSLVSLRGEDIGRKTLDGSYSCRFETSRVVPGIYLIGNNRCGWAGISIRQ